MNPKLFLGLTLVLIGRLFGSAQTASAEESAIRGHYQAYWLSNQAAGKYVKLVLTRKPLAELPGLVLTTNQPVLDCDAVIATTYARDSLWDIDWKPFKPLLGVEMAGTNFLVIKGERFACTNANLEDVLRLLHNPMGKIPISRITTGVSAEMEPIRTLALRLERQSDSRKRMERSAEQDAINTALNFIRTNHLDTSQYEMSAPEAVQHILIEGPSAWRISWRHNTPAGAAPIKGGQIVVLVHDSGRIERGFGE